MRVTVTAKGHVADRLPGPVEVELPDGAGPGEAARAAGLPALSYVYVVNGTALARGARLRDGDRLWLYPPSAGG
ncbi:MAG: hypothetical protein ACOYY2_11940 [Actinomycetota bacterium]